MYRCQICGNLVPKGTVCQKVVLATRTKEYPFRKKANPRFAKKQRGPSRFRNRGIPDKADDRGGTGLETVKEVNACDKCAKQYRENQS